MTLKFEPTLPSSNNEIESLLKVFNSIPKEYLEFLNKYNGIYPPINILLTDGGEFSVHAFLSTKEIMNFIDNVKEFFDNKIPIARDHSGNIFCVSTDDECVLFWDHEIGTYQKIAQSFSDFLEKLEEFDPSSLDLDVSKAKVWIHPDFKPKFRR